MNAKFAAVITTIQEPTDCVRGLVTSLEREGGRLIAIGDQKGPARFEVSEPQLCDFYSLVRQRELPYSLATLLPTKHYARKNLGYLIAMSQGAALIYETDDDNMPADGWKPYSMSAEVQVVEPRRWMNVYRLFTDDLIWPRGFPLDRITDATTYAHDTNASTKTVEAVIQQGLANLSPDVDAVWRLALDRDFNFRSAPSVWLGPGTWCPFNSQNTWWWPPAYPLLYLPSYCSFRMTDIWRSFIAQRCLWEMGGGLVFRAADVIQQRNVHNLMRDFSDEVPGYLQNDKIVSILTNLSLKSGAAAVGENLLRCYEALTADGIFPDKETPLVKAWIEAVSSMPRSSRQPT